MKTKPPLPLLAAIAALPPLAVDTYLPAIPGIAADLGTSISFIQNTLSIFLLGFGLGLLTFGPLSDRFGRRPLCLFGLSGFALASLLLGAADSGTAFLLIRLLQGFLGSAATIIVPAMIRDCYGANTARGMSSVMMLMLVAPLVAPLLGSFLLGLAAWPLIFHFLTAYTLLLGLLAFRWLPETRPEDQPGQRRGFLASYKLILARRAIHGDLLSFMLVAVAFFTFVTSVAFVYISWFGVSETRFGLLFAFAAISLFLANSLNLRFVSRLGARRMLYLGLTVAGVAATLLLLFNLLGFGLWWTVACFFFIVGSLGLVSVNADSLIIIHFPHHASSAAAVTGTLRFGSGALAGPLLALLHTGTPVPVAGLILGCILLAAVLQAFVAWQGGGDLAP